MGMSIPYESVGRTHQKARTRAALLAATRDLLAEGLSPTVEQAADRAEISRTTAYRYFPNRRALLTAVYPEIDEPSLLDADAPTPAGGSSSCWSASSAKCWSTSLSCACSCAFPWNPARLSPNAYRFAKDALSHGSRMPSPLRAHMTAVGPRRLVRIRATTGIEALVWLTDVAGLTRQDAAELMRSSARALLQEHVEPKRQTT